MKKQKLYKQKRVALERPGMFTKGSRRKNLNIQKRVALERPIKECYKRFYSYYNRKKNMNIQKRVAEKE